LLSVRVKLQHLPLVAIPSAERYDEHFPRAI
jgi:hypothetical protein